MKFKIIKPIQLSKKKSIIFLILFLGAIQFCFTQVQTYQLTPNTDTTRVIQIIKANSLRQITVNDSTVLETLAGNAKVSQGNTILEGDSIIIDKKIGRAHV